MVSYGRQCLALMQCSEAWKIPSCYPFLEEASFVSTDPTKAYRDQLTFEQQARFDALYARRAKKEGTARTLSLPLLGTFGAEQFYLGHSVRGVVSVLFSWTLIPTVVALFDLANGDLKRQVALANTRVAREVYQNVLHNTIGADAVPAAAASVVNAPPAAVPPPPPTPAPAVDVAATAAAAATAATAAAVAAAAEAAETPPAVTETVPAAEAAPTPEAVIAADSIVDATPATPVVAEAVAAEEDVTADTTATFTQTTTTAAWEAGMDAPATTSDTQTATVGESAVIAAAAAAEESAPAAAVDSAPPEVVAVVVPAETAPEGTLGTVPPDESPVVVLLDAAPASEAIVEAPAVAAVVETPAAPGTDDAANDGVLVFMDDAAPAAPANGATTVVVADAAPEGAVAEDAQQTEETTLRESLAEGTAESDQQYVDGKLVSASRNETRLTGDINTLVTEHHEDSLLAEVEARAGMPTGWVDVSPLHPGSAQGTSGTPPTDVARDTGGTGSGGTNTPGGDLGNGGTDTPGGDLGGGTGGTDTPPERPGDGRDGPIAF
jgi:hypothetical protein